MLWEVISSVYVVHNPVLQNNQTMAEPAAPPEQGINPPTRTVIWLTGYPGCGKTTGGDFLAAQHDFAHIDVDYEFMFPVFSGRKKEEGRSSSTGGDGEGASVGEKSDPQTDPVVGPWLRYWGEVRNKGVLSPPTEVVDQKKIYGFEPMLKAVCGKIREVCANNSRIVVTQGVTRPQRDFVREQLVSFEQQSSGGAGGLLLETDELTNAPPIQVFFLALTAADLDTKIRRQLGKSRRFQAEMKRDTVGFWVLRRRTS